VVEDPEAEAVALDGWANTLRVKGAFPAARRRLMQALDLARTAGSDYALGSVHQSLMTVAALAGETGAALEHGWASVEAYATARDQLRALVTVAGLLLELDEARLAEQAYQVALEHLEEPYFRLFALDGYAHAAALQGDRQLYEARSIRLDQEDWRVGGPDFEGQVYLYRGRAWEQLGKPARARSWFERALALAESHGLAKTLFEAQGGLDRLNRGAVAGPPASPERLTATAAASMVGRLERVDRRLAGATA
jgi:tetratricopeptide (TPR) repeat protein